MREILFRGKRLDNGEWAEGDYINSVTYPEKAWITEYKTLFDRQLCDIGIREVDPSTVGQYTGLTDKNGKKIFEGDIIRKLCQVYKLDRRELIGERWVIGEVIWDDECATYPGCWAICAKDDCGNPTNYEFTNDFEIVGNVHDNPELLRKEAQT